MVSNFYFFILKAFIIKTYYLVILKIERVMKIYTSYFGNVKKLEKENVVPISIALYSPRWRKWNRLPEAAPKKFMLSEDLSIEEYIEAYNKEILSKIDLDDFLKMIKIMSGGKDVALLCYEKPGDFCHRHLLAKWLTEKTGIKIEEFGVVISKNETTEQAQLF